MRCCKIINPMGVDPDHIDFSWKSDRLVKKIRIFVSSCYEKNIDGEGDLWDTGWVEHDYRVFWPYKGIELNTHHLYHWKVNILYEENGRVYCEQGESQYFLTGLDQIEWKGNWICGTDAKNIYSKQLLFVKKLKGVHISYRIYAYIATYGYHSFYINGKKIDNRVFAPSRSKYTGYKKVISVAYDITDYLNESENVLQILTDAGWTRAEHEVKPCINVQIYSEDGSIEAHSDRSWKVVETGNITRNRYVEGDNANEFGWADWGNEEIINLNPLDSCDMQFGEMPEILEIHPEIIGEKTEKDMILDRFAPLQVEKSEIVKIDMGRNFTGFLVLTVYVDGEREILVKVSDKKEESMSYNQKTKFILSKGMHELKNQFQYISGRYFEIFGGLSNDKIEHIEGLQIGTSLMRTGYFRCSDETLNKIFETDLHTFLCNTVGSVTMDCPHRERLGYGETGINTLTGCGLPFFRSAAFYNNYFHMWIDCQEESGYFPHVVPNYHGGGGTAWSSFPVIGFYEYWKLYHDMEALQNIYPALKKWCLYLISKCKNGILQRYEFGEWDFLGDWAAPNGRNDWGDSEEALCFNNMYFALVLKIMMELAEYGDCEEDTKEWKGQFEHLAQKLHEKYFRYEEHYYYAEEAKYQALAILSDIVPDQYRDTVYRKMLYMIQKNGYLDGGSVGNTILLKILSRSEEGNSLVYQWLHRDQAPSYKFFLDKGETTWPEMWNIDNIYGSSRIHTCYTGIAGWFLYGLMGINMFWRQGKFQHEVRPYYPKELEWAEIEFETPFGKFKYEWEKGRL